MTWLIAFCQSSVIIWVCLLFYGHVSFTYFKPFLLINVLMAIMLRLGVSVRFVSSYKPSPYFLASPHFHQLSKGRYHRKSSSRRSNLIRPHYETIYVCSIHTRQSSSEKRPIFKKFLEIFYIHVLNSRATRSCWTNIKIMMNWSV